MEQSNNLINTILCFVFVAICLSVAGRGRKAPATVGFLSGNLVMLVTNRTKTETLDLILYAKEKNIREWSIGPEKEERTYLVDIHGLYQKGTVFEINAKGYGNPVISNWNYSPMENSIHSFFPAQLLIANC